MTAEKRKRRRPLGFVVGVLVVVVPLAGYLLYRHTRSPMREAVGVRQEPRVRVPERSRAPIDLAIDESGLQVAGASVPDELPPPAVQAIDGALRRAEAWLRGHSIDPFGGAGVDSLRLFALEVQCWDRIAMAAGGTAAKQALADEVAGRMRRFMDPVRLNERVLAQGQPQGVLEILILAARCRDYGVDPGPLMPLVESLVPAVVGSLERMPDATAALYVSQFESVGIDVGRSLDGYRRTGLLAAQPREVKMTISDVRALSQEILAYTGLAQRRLEGLTTEEHDYLHRVLPYFALAYTLLRNHELMADLLCCLNLAGMTETYGYREGLRVLMTRQNDDGSFGSEAAGSSRTTKLATTTSCLTALSLERMRVSGER